MSENDEEFVTKALNAHGVFFKKAVRTHLEGLNVKILGEEYPIRFPDSASIDLLAAIKVQGTLVIMPIECKRAYAARKEWVFFQDPDKKTRFGYVFRGYRCDSLSIDPSSDYVGFGRDLVCVEGVEIDQDKRSQPLKAA